MKDCKEGWHGAYAYACADLKAVIKMLIPE